MIRSRSVRPRWEGPNPHRKVAFISSLSVRPPHPWCGDPRWWRDTRQGISSIAPPGWAPRRGLCHPSLAWNQTCHSMPWGLPTVGAFAVGPPSRGSLRRRSCRPPLMPVRADGVHRWAPSPLSSPAQNARTPSVPPGASIRGDPRLPAVPGPCAMARLHPSCEHPLKKVSAVTTSQAPVRFSNRVHLRPSRPHRVFLPLRKPCSPSP